MKLAPAGKKSQQDLDWRNNELVGCVDKVIDAWDNQEWLEATIFETREEEVAPGRTVLLAYVAFRVYRNHGKKLKQDDRGIYDGWSNKYDDWLPVFSPLIAPHMTKSQGIVRNQELDDDELDDVI